MADNLSDIRTYLKAFTLGLGATGLLRAKLPEGIEGLGATASLGEAPVPPRFPD
jgi:hypothetical protein